VPTISIQTPISRKPFDAFASLRRRGGGVWNPNWTTAIPRTGAARSSDKTASGQISRGRVVPNVIVTVVIVILIEVIRIVVILAKAMACR
jgi:hypothetical protein